MVFRSAGNGLYESSDIYGDRDLGAGAGRRRHLRAIDGAVERVALDGYAAGFADQALEFAARGELSRLGAGIVINLLLNYCAVQVVGPKAQGDLRDARREHYPIRLDVVEVVEQQARNGDGFKIVIPRRRGQMRESRIRRVKRQRNECSEAVRFILQFTQGQKMIDALFFRFDVAVKHRSVGAQADFMRRARDVEPLLAADLVVADNFPHPRMKNFGAAAGQRVHARILERQESVANRKLGDAREVSHLDHRERFQVHCRAAFFQAAHQVEEIFKWQIGMEAANHVEFRRAFAHSLFGPLVNLFECKRVRAGRVGIAAKRAKLAMRDAHVGGIDVAIYVEKTRVAVAVLADGVRKPANREQVRGAIEQDAVVKAQALACEHFVRNRL